MTKTREPKIFAVSASSNLNIVKIRKDNSKIHLVNQYLTGHVIENLTYCRSNLLLLFFRDDSSFGLFDYNKGLLLQRLVSPIDREFTVVALTPLTFAEPF